METAVCTDKNTAEGAVMETQQELRPDLHEVVQEILALRAFSKTDHFFTHKAQRKILARLNAKDLAAVVRAIQEAEKRQRPICVRTAERG